MGSCSTPASSGGARRVVVDTGADSGGVGATVGRSDRDVLKRDPERLVRCIPEPSARGDRARGACVREHRRPGRETESRGSGRDPGDKERTGRGGRRGADPKTKVRGEVRGDSRERADDARRFAAGDQVEAGDVARTTDEREREKAWKSER